MVARLLARHMARSLACLMALVMVLSVCAGSSHAQDAQIRDMSVKELDALVQKTTKEGRGVFINFFATWCPPCRFELPMVAQLEKKYGKKVLFIGLCVDDKKDMEKVVAFKKDKKIAYPVFMASRDLVAKYGVSTIPYNVGYDKKGKMAFAYVGVVEEDELEDLVAGLQK